MLIGILETGHVPGPLRGQSGSYPDMFRQLLAGHGFTFRDYAVVDMEFPADVHDADGWLITGSRHAAYDDLPFVHRLQDFIRDAHTAGVPMVGICFGHQIIAQALGGRVEKFAGGWAAGPQEYDFDGQKIWLNAWHQDQVVAAPPGAEVITTNPFCAIAGLAYGDQALTIQAHPEFSREFLAGLMRERGKGVVPDELLAAAAARQDQPLDAATISDRIARFFKTPRPANR